MLDFETRRCSATFTVEQPLEPTIAPSATRPSQARNFIIVGTCIGFIRFESTIGLWRARDCMLVKRTSWKIIPLIQNNFR